jgi:rhodanese-related sulfurtransferase
MIDRQKREKKVLTLGLVLILGVALFTFFRSSISNKNEKISQNSNNNNVQYSTISPNDLWLKIKNKENIEIIDIRSPDLYADEHIADSINIPLEEMGSDNIIIDKNKTVIILDQSEEKININRALKILQGKELKNILVLSGGITNWTYSYVPSVSQGDPYSFVDQSKVTFIKQEDAKKILDEKRPVFLLDVRDSKQFSPRIPGAINIPLESLEKRRNEIPTGKAIIVYGDSELEGFQAGVRLHDLNFLSVSVLKEGFTSWKAKGFLVE